MELPELLKIRRGFTMVEMALVLVIIGLLVGGVLVGRDMIHNAMIRSQITQIEKLNTSVMTFKLKYGAIPGDIQPAVVNTVGMASRTGARGHGDGNGLIESCSGSQTETILSCESSLFWNDLGFAKLIPGTYELNTDSSIEIAAGEAWKYLPTSTISKTGSIAVFKSNWISGNNNNCMNSNCIAIAEITTNAAPSYLIMAQEVLTPGQAFSIDAKLDDGVPRTGRVRSGRITSPGLMSKDNAGGGNCLVAGASAYKVDTTSINVADCLINFQFKW